MAGLLRRARTHPLGGQPGNRPPTGWSPASHLLIPRRCRDIPRITQHVQNRSSAEKWNARWLWRPNSVQQTGLEGSWGAHSRDIVTSFSSDLADECVINV